MKSTGDRILNLKGSDTNSHVNGLVPFDNTRMQNKKVAFTLAEVLITLGVIGIVAAMTIPTLMSKIEHKILLSQFKKSYATMMQTLKMVQNEHEGEYSCYLYGYGKYSTSECKDFYDNYFKTLRASSCIYSPQNKCGIKYKDGQQVVNSGGNVPNLGCNFPLQYVYTLLDGTKYYVYFNSCFFAIDINGDKPPNKWGYDVFYVTFIKDNNRTYIPLKLGQNTCIITEKDGYTIDKMIKEIGR